MDIELRAQVGYMTQIGCFSPSAKRGEPGSMDDFVARSAFERRQIVRECAVQGLEGLRESTPGVPWKADDMDWAEAAMLHLEQGGARTMDDYQALRERGVPLVDHDGPASLDGDDDPDMLQAMAECGVLRGRAPSPRQLTPLAALVDVGVPLREADTPWRADDRPHVEIARDLGRVVPPSHPDREHLTPILRAGAALSADEKNLIDSLASKHAAALQSLNAEPDEDADEQVGLQESARRFEEALREAGVAFREGSTPGKYVLLADYDEADLNAPVLTGDDALIAAGIPLKKNS